VRLTNRGIPITVIRHSREKPALECSNRGRESSVVWVVAEQCSRTPLGPRFRGDDELGYGLAACAGTTSVWLGSPFLSVIPANAGIQRRGVAAEQFARTPLGPRFRGDDECAVGQPFPIRHSRERGNPASWVAAEQFARTPLGPRFRGDDECAVGQPFPIRYSRERGNPASWGRGGAIRTNAAASSLSRGRQTRLRVRGLRGDYGFENRRSHA
jgi:hypothetical protein